MSEKKTPRLAVIMPAYNAQATVEAAVRSVLDQSFSDLTLLVVDDGSTDGTLALLQKLQGSDERLQVLSVPNGGPALARNRALERLSPETEYLMFIDADDLLLPDAAEYAIRGAETGAELVIFGYAIVGVDGSVRRYQEPEQSIPAEELGKCFGRLYKANLLNQVWGKLYSAALVREHEIRFPDYRWGEDRLFNFDVLEHVTRLCILPECKYHYLMHEGESLITRYYDRKFAVCLEIDRRVEELCWKYQVEDDSDFRYMFVKSVFSCLTNLFAPSCPLSGVGRADTARKILDNSRVQSRSHHVSGGAPARALCHVLHSRSVRLTLAAARSMIFAGELAPELFLRLKHRK